LDIDDFSKKDYTISSLTAIIFFIIWSVILKKYKFSALFIGFILGTLIVNYLKRKNTPSKQYCSH